MRVGRLRSTTLASILRSIEDEITYEEARSHEGIDPFPLRSQKQYLPTCGSSPLYRLVTVLRSRAGSTSSLAVDTGEPASGADDNDEGAGGGSEDGALGEEDDDDGCDAGGAHAHGRVSESTLEPSTSETVSTNAPSRHSNNNNNSNDSNDSSGSGVTSDLEQRRQRWMAQYRSSSQLRISSDPDLLLGLEAGSDALGDTVAVPGSVIPTSPGLSSRPQPLAATRPSAGRRTVSFPELGSDPLGGGSPASQRGGVRYMGQSRAGGAGGGAVSVQPTTAMVAVLASASADGGASDASDASNANGRPTAGHGRSSLPPLVIGDRAMPDAPASSPTTATDASQPDSACFAASPMGHAATTLTDRGPLRGGIGSSFAASQEPRPSLSTRSVSILSNDHGSSSATTSVASGVAVAMAIPSLAIRQPSAMSVTPSSAPVSRSVSITALITATTLSAPPGNSPSPVEASSTDSVTTTTEATPESWHAEYEHIDTDWSMQAMDILYNASFYSFIRDERNVDLSALRLARLVKEYKPKQVSAALKWMMQGWSIEVSAKLLRLVFADWLPDLAGCVFALVCYGWPLKPQIGLCTAYVLLSEPPAVCALFVRSLTAAWRQDCTIDLISYLDALLEWDEEFFHEFVMVYSTLVGSGGAGSASTASGGDGADSAKAFVSAVKSAVGVKTATAAAAAATSGMPLDRSDAEDTDGGVSKGDGSSKDAEAGQDAKDKATRPVPSADTSSRRLAVASYKLALADARLALAEYELVVLRHTASCRTCQQNQIEQEMQTVRREAGSDDGSGPATAAASTSLCVAMDGMRRCLADLTALVQRATRGEGTAADGVADGQA